ncbi:dopaminechrome tautomerase-like [Branchiostoma lanceolatum]|uniref:dopaminechrome tautomerase-like n=1 Tax=Branchiostoma lanceolatum TaxID=7740 RepID=UPI003455D412
MCRLFVGLVSLLIGLFLRAGRGQMYGDAELVHEWVGDQLDYTWPPDADRQNALNSGAYIPDNNGIVGIKVHRSVVYVTVPRWREGVPASLAAVQDGPDRALLRPFPGWDWHDPANCSVLQYVQTLWAGLYFRGVTPINACPPQLIVYDIIKGVVVRDFTFPNDVASYDSSFLNDLVVDTSDPDPNKWFAYITDTSGDGAIIVYDFYNNLAHKVTDPSMAAEEDATILDIHGVQVNTRAPVDGIALSPVSSADHRVYYCSLAGYSLFSVPSSVLRDPDVSAISNQVTNHGRKVSQSDGLAMSDTGVLYFGALTLDGVYKWDTSLPLSSQELVLANHTKMQWVDTFGFDEKGCLWFADKDKIQDNLVGTANFTGQVSRVWKVYVGEGSYMSVKTSGEKKTSNSVLITLVATAISCLSVRVFVV